MQEESLKLELCFLFQPFSLVFFFKCVARVWIRYCLRTMKRAGFQVCELE